MAESTKNKIALARVVMALALSGLVMLGGCKNSLLQNIQEDVERAKYVGTPALVVTQGATEIEAGQSCALFQDVPINAVDTRRQFIIQNDGDGDLLLSGAVAVSLAGDPVFEIGDSAKKTYAPGETDGFYLLFNPGDITSYSTALTIHSNDPNRSEFSFTVTGNGIAADEDQPTIAIKDPDSGATRVPIGTNISVTFSEPMRASVATDAIFKLYPQGSPSSLVAGVYARDGDGDVVSFDPSSSLLPNAQYTVEIHGDAADLAGLKLLGGTYTWSFTTLPLPAAPTLTSPANAAVDQSVSPTLDWSDASDAESYEVFYNTTGTFGSTPNATLTGAPPSSQYPLSGLSRATTYYWKVVAVNSSGKTPSAGTFTFTTVPNAPATAPTLIAPADKATGLGTTVTLSWNTASGATSYKVYCDADNSDPTTERTPPNHTGTSYVMSTSYSHRYYWKVEALNAGGSAVSGIWYFDTLYPPGAPSLSSPANGAIGQSTSVSLTWSAGSGGTPAKYHVYCDTNASPTTLRTGTGTTATSYSLSAMSAAYGTGYYWKVVAENAAGTGPASTIRNFYTLYAPALDSPAAGATGILSPVTVSWSAASGATSYKVYCDTNTTPTTLKASPTTTSCSFTVPYSTRHYWRVESVNASTGAVVSSVTRDFYTLYPPASFPALSAPADGATDLLSPVSLSWSSVSGATAYIVYCDTSASPTTERTNTSYSSTSYSFAASYSEAYYWKVRAWNAAGLGPSSSIRLFKTLKPPNAAPTPIAPAEGAKAQSPFVKFSWSSVIAATQYDVFCDTSSTPTTLLRGNVAALYCYPTTPLTYGATLYWRVRGENAAGAGPYSSAPSFTTRKDVQFPLNGSTGVARTPIEADWPAYSGANAYRLWLRLLPAGSWTMVPQTANHYYFNTTTADSLPANTSFEWYYQAYNGTTLLFTSSPLFTFTTGP